MTSRPSSVSVLLTTLAKGWQCFALSLQDGLRFAREGKPSSFSLSRFLFLRLLGLVYLAAFVSLWVQVKGLIGSHGILPVEDFLAAVSRQLSGAERFYLVPTLCWLNPSDEFLTGLCAGGVILSCLLIVGLAPVPVLFFLWAFYLSLTVAGQNFLSFQWDTLLLESGFLAILYAPLGLWLRSAHHGPAPRAVLQLLRWLLFRLVFGSGVVKLTSGDPTWRNLTALTYHYETQPLPMWTSWVMHQLPARFHKGEVLLTFLAEILVPLFLFGPRRCRHLACAAIVGFQLLIAATGNYGFFNLLTIVLCVPLLDDDLFPARLRARLVPAAQTTALSPGQKWSGGLLVIVASSILLVSIVPLLWDWGLLNRGPRILLRTYQAIVSFRSINTYGLFRVMTTERHEIVVEGSNDGKNWLAYEFKWKPGDPKRLPAPTGLHMPRLDWQMWFAALDKYENNPWFIHFLAQLLRGSPEVLELLERNPFPDRPPRYIRAVVYDYHFTDWATYKETGARWRRERLDLYCPVLSLQRSRDRS